MLSPERNKEIIGIISAIPIDSKKTAPKYQDVFGFSIIELAKKNDKEVILEAFAPNSQKKDYISMEIFDKKNIHGFGGLY